MTKDPLEVAKKLIAAGKKGKNPNLIKMGEELIEKHKVSNQPDFITTTRKEGFENRAVYDENGNIIGRKTRREPVNISKNTFKDTKTEFMNDKQNEMLKKYTIHSPRTRPTAKKVAVTCYMCHKIEQVNPIHAAGEFHRCNECAKRNKRV